VFAEGKRKKSEFVRCEKRVLQEVPRKGIWTGREGKKKEQFPSV